MNKVLISLTTTLKKEALFTNKETVLAQSSLQ